MKEQIIVEATGAIYELKSTVLACLQDMAIVTMIKILGLIPYKDGNQWCVRWGENIQEGICGFGNTPMEAIADFNYHLNH